jgi:hypothetical protein
MAVMTRTRPAARRFELTTNFLSLRGCARTEAEAIRMPAIFSMRF